MLTVACDAPGVLTARHGLMPQRGPDEVLVPEQEGGEFGFVAHGGLYVLVSIVKSAISFSDPEFHKRETSLPGSRNATEEDSETVVSALRTGRIPTDRLNLHRMSLADAPVVFATLLDPGEGVVAALIEV